MARGFDFIGKKKEEKRSERWLYFSFGLILVLLFFGMIFFVVGDRFIILSPGNYSVSLSWPESFAVFVVVMVLIVYFIWFAVFKERFPKVR